MNDRQLEYFKNKLLDWKEDILRESRETVTHLQSETENHPDLADRASSETDRALELRTRDRQRKLISKIDEALDRIRDGSFGYCEETGDPIGIGRLLARPIATLSIEATQRVARGITAPEASVTVRPTSPKWGSGCRRSTRAWGGRACPRRRTRLARARTCARRGE